MKLLLANLYKIIKYFQFPLLLGYQSSDLLIMGLNKMKGKSTLVPDNSDVLYKNICLTLLHDCVGRVWSSV